MIHARAVVVAAFGVLLVGAVPAAAASPTLDAIRERGNVRCGVHPGLAGFSEPQADGSYRGFDADLCAAVAAAVLDDPTAVAWVPVDAAGREAALTGGTIDLLSRNTTWTLGREATWGTFVATTFYDGQTILAPSAAPVTTLGGLAGRTVCALDGTSSLDVIRTALADAGVTATVIAQPDLDTEVAAYLDGGCDALTSDRSQLAAIGSTLPDGASHAIAPLTLTREPLGPVVPSGDEAWATIVRWIAYSLVIAEEHDLSGRAAAQALPGSDPELRRMFGAADDPGATLGLTPGWAARAVAAVGNYGELYERWLGPSTPLALERGLNALWTDGGLLYAPPFR